MRFEDLPDVMTVNQAARYLRISRNRAYEEIAQGKIPAIRFGRSIRVTKWGLAKLLGRPDEPEATQPENDTKGVAV